MREEDKVNEVQAMEELGMTSPEQFAGNDRFTWIPFYMEMAKKLLEYKDDRRELVKIVYEMDEKYISFFNDENKQPFQDLHPFALYGIFNRYIALEKRQEICSHFKKCLSLESNLPVDFDSIPLMNNQNSWWGMPKIQQRNRFSLFMNNQNSWRGNARIENDTAEDIAINWKIFEIIQDDDLDIENFEKFFDYIRSRGGAKWSLTMALFWIRPYDFMPLDANSRAYLSKIGIEVFEEKNLNARNYLNLIQKIKSKIMSNEIHEKSFPEISYNAWRKDENSQGGPTMQGSDEKLNEYVDLLKSTKNLILTGAPGTGKTYLARQIAQAMGCSSQEIGFVQFHPSYDYTDFVEGLRPVQDESGSGQIGFERKDGVFKEFCARALQNLENQTMIDTDINSFDTAWNCLTNEVRENIADGKLTKIGIWEYSLSSTGSLKYSSKDTQSKYTFTITKQNVFDAWRGIKARPSGYFQKYMKEVADYMKKFGLSEYNPNKNLSNNKIKSFVFIIDEINRGEVAKIFGELFYSVDPGYRVTAKDIEEIKSGQKTITAIRTQYANLEADGNAFDNALNIIDENDYGHFFVPENVYIIGTMNDIDRSVESMDFAFRRRFAWVEVKASHTEDMLDKLNEFRPDLAEVAKNRMKRLNDAISATQDFGPAYHIGASYFL
ncbi:MAG: AAA family ATPase, partial [Spirochaetaceae bacterium]|nr:AAA family ATPase [Spirochaetaceae bacterium]